ncbi:uncharacterized protein LOC131433682 [Malaya genurostris]|uniref:uncharacterized protein LOC131433682 n=1 Tax=Malaya genurostris TaxID=325434 RepID=UPI0026F3CDCE|nr:uncharacterized protein LOC131433682 [Malaya genurostris]
MADHLIKVQTFQDLKHAEDQLKHIPLKKIARIALNSLRRQESDVDVYEFLFAKVLYMFDPNEFETEIAQVLLPELGKHLHKIAVELEDNALSCFIIDNLKSMLSIANVVLKFAEYIIGNSETYQFYKSITIFLEFLTRSYEIIRLHIHTINPGTDEEDFVKQLFSLCQKIQFLISNMLTAPEGSGQYFRHLDIEDEFDCLKNVIDYFCKIGSLTIGLDTRLSTEVWKTVVKLISTHQKQMETNDTRWLHVHVLNINDEVEKFFKSMMDSKEISKNVLIKLKFNGLLLKVLLKVLMVVKDGFKDYNKLLNTIVAIENTLLTKTLAEDLIVAVRQHLTVGYMNLIGSVFSNVNFAEAIFSIDYQSTEEILALIKIVEYLISKLIADDQNGSMVDLYLVKTNLLSMCVRHLSKSHMLFNQHRDIYRTLVVHLSGFILICAKRNSKTRQKILEETLVSMILQDSFWVGLVGLDIWSVYLRYQSAGLLWPYFLFWKVLNDQFSIFVSQPKAIFVSRLLKNLYEFLPSSMQLKVWTLYPITDKSNYKLWLTIGLDKVDPKLVSGVKKNLTQHLKEFCSSKFTQVTSQQLYECIYIIHLICGFNDRNLLQMIVPEIAILCNTLQISKTEAVKTSSLLCAMLLLIAKFSEHSLCVPSSIKTNILQDVCSLSLSSKFMFLSQNQKNLELRKLFTEDSNILIKTMASYHERSNVALNTTNSSITRLSYQMVQNVISHRCSLYKDTSDITNHFDSSFDEFVLTSTLMETDNVLHTNPKRPKMDIVEKTDCDDAPCTAINSISTLRQHVLILQGLHRHGGLDKDQLDEIKKVGSILSSFGN